MQKIASSSDDSEQAKALRRHQAYRKMADEEIQHMLQTIMSLSSRVITSDIAEAPTSDSAKSGHDSEDINQSSKHDLADDESLSHSPSSLPTVNSEVQFYSAFCHGVLKEANRFEATETHASADLIRTSLFNNDLKSTQQPQECQNSCLLSLR